MGSLDRRTLVLALAGLATPALAFQPAADKFHLTLRTLTRRVHVNGDLDIIVTVQARQLCVLPITGAFRADGFQVHAIGPDGAQHEPRVVGREGRRGTLEGRRLGAGSIYQTTQILAGRGIFELKGRYSLAVSYTPPDYSQFTAGQDQAVIDRFSRGLVSSHIPLLTSDDGLMSEPLEVTVD